MHGVQYRVICACLAYSCVCTACSTEWSPCVWRAVQSGLRVHGVQYRRDLFTPICCRFLCPTYEACVTPEPMLTNRCASQHRAPISSPCCSWQHPLPPTTPPTPFHSRFAMCIVARTIPTSGPGEVTDQKGNGTWSATAGREIETSLLWLPIYVLVL